MTLSDFVLVCFAALLLITTFVALATFGYLACLRFKQMQDDNFSLKSVTNFTGLMDSNKEAVLVPIACIAAFWPLLTYLIIGHVGRDSLPFLVIDVMLLASASLALRSVPRIKKISAIRFSIFTAIYCSIFILVQVGAEYYLSDPPLNTQSDQNARISVSESPSAISVEFEIKSDPDALKASGLSIGSCTNLSLQRARSLQTVSCGTESSVYRVVQIVSTIKHCVSDIDKAASFNDLPYAVCLDYDWSNNHCLKITETHAQSSTCTVAGVERFQKVIIGAIDDKSCEHGGFIHDVRKFTVCTMTQ